MQGVKIFFLAKDYIIADSIVELVLHEHVLQRIVADKPGSQFIFIKLREPFHKSAIYPRGWLCSKEVRRSLACLFRDSRLFLIGMDNLFILTLEC